MSWLTEITARAENMLNKIDENAATMFNNKTVQIGKQYLNNSEAPKDSFNSNYGSTLKLKKKTDDDEIMIEDVIHSNFTNLCAQNNSIGKMEDSDLHVDMLQNEVHSLNRELSALLHRSKLSEEETDRLKAELESCKRQNETLKQQILECSSSQYHGQGDYENVRSSSIMVSDTNCESLSNMQDILKENKRLKYVLKEKEEEIMKLKNHDNWNPSEFSEDQRLEMLNKSMAEKQSDLELLAASNKALQFRFDLLQKKHYDTLSMLKESSVICHINDTDDAKAQVPSFFRESSFFDTVVARRVKKAYSFIDAISIRAGGFLRRYPLCRFSMLFYVVLLHVWVLLVLFSYMPDVKQR